MPFAKMVTDLFASALAHDAVYRVAGAAPGVAVRVIPAAPDQSAGLFDVKARVTARYLDVMSATIAQPAEGDLIDVVTAFDGFPAGTYRVAEPMADDLRLIWRLLMKAV